MSSLKRFAAPAGALVLIAWLGIALTLPERSILAGSLLGVGLMLVLLGTLLNFSAILDIFKGRAVREGGGVVAYAIIVAVVLALLNFLVARHHQRIDLTAQGAFSLSEQTLKILRALPRDVEARAYYYPGTLDEQKAKDTLAEYAYQAPQKFKVQFIDPLKDPQQAKSDGVTQEQSIVLHSGSQTTTVVAGDEEAITNAILKITKDQVKILCFAIGHGEKDVKDTGPEGYSAFTAAVEKQQAKVETFSPAMGVPDHCAVVVIAGPSRAWVPAEVEKIGAYLDKGGKAAVLLDPLTESGLSPLLGRYGIHPDPDLIIDRVSTLFGGKPDIPMVPADGYDSHPITKSFRYQTFYPLAESLTLASPPPADVTLQSLAKTTPLSWGERNYEREAATGKLRLDPEDKPGPLVLGAVATKPVEGAAKNPGDSEKTGKPETRLVVFGDSDFPANAYFNATGNGELFQNVTNWLAGQEDLVAIGAKSRLPSLVTLSQRQASLIWVSILLAPVSILLIGTVIWFRRRKL